MKTVLIPDEVYERAAELAARDNVSVDRLVSAVVNEHVGGWARLQERANRGSLDKLKEGLAKVRDVPADAANQL